jgi:acetyl-CoA acetyltransferase
VRQTPFLDRDQHRPQGTATVCQVVLAAGRVIGVGPAFDQSLVDEALEPGTEDVARRAGPGSDATEAMVLPEQLADDRHWAQRYPAIDWKVTAGNSSSVNDGAAAVLVTSEEAAERLGLTPRARLHSFAVVGDDPIYMLTGIIPATAKVLARAGLSIDDIDAFEVTEAFASVVLAWQKETGADLHKVNVNGGAIAIGHPLGATGARLTMSLLSVLEQTGGRYGLQVTCEAGGLANATIIEQMDG